eukprot:290005_1
MTAQKTLHSDKKNNRTIVSFCSHLIQSRVFPFNNDYAQKQKPDVIDDYCEKAKPGKKDLQNWRYKKHLEKISKQINTITKIQIAIPIQDIQIEQITNIPNVQIAVTSSGYYILKPTHKVTFAAFLDTFRITKYKAHKMLIKLDERTFGFSRKVVWIQSHNVMDSIKTLCKDSHINVKWMSVQEVEHN